MISHKYRCIFIHIPKCAGTSIEKSLGGQDHRTIRMIAPINIKAFLKKENIIELLRRLKYKYIITVSNPKNKITVTKKQYNSYFKFTFIRNPWARAFSWYKNVMRDEIHRKSYGITKQISLKEFLRLYAGKGMLRPQLYWIKDFNGNIPLDYIGRFENLAEDFKKIYKELNLSNITLPHMLKGCGEDYRKYYDDESQEIIMQHYKEEIQMFEYKFD